MLELDDDPETLRAALAFLDGEDVSISAPTLKEGDSPSPSTDCSGQSEQPPTKKRVMSSLTRQRMNILALREEVRRLEGELRAQKRKSKKRSSVHREREELGKAIALRQRRAHEQAEAESVNLRARIESLFRLDGKVASALLAGTYALNNGMPRQLRHPWSIEETYARLETMFKQSLWRYMARMHISIPGPEYHADNQASDDSIITTYVFPPDEEDESEYRAKEVTKKFGQQGQPRVVVTALNGETADSTNEDLLIHEIWWMRVQAIQTDKNEQVTQVQSCSRTYVRSRNADTLDCSVQEVIRGLKDESEDCQATVETFLLCSKAPSSTSGS
ncbi:hypothetical protein Poli38472_004939 [Pythium oligandrum]|uniref:Uncharacterized protein n=1 Tax=Pythium oligandrum TaxID=41045 RepID=A0A8K1CBQ2_PYTOL|nr:hypothetical protein Poli38472_004939 [Pythium oligandrum]|eukprot:TMW59870.1 hypothetical protein Poli38472_004939 [Pythium oligandrum]